MTTGLQIIALARSFFGEVTPNSVTVEQARDYLTTALHEIWADLPASDLKPLIEIDNVVLTPAGEGAVNNTYERVIDVYLDGVPALAVNKEIISNADFGSLFEPAVPVYYIDESNIFVRPLNGAASVDIIHVQPPPRITAVNEGAELLISSGYQEAVAFLMASYMYAQEEDPGQAQQMRSEYVNLITSVSAQTASEG